MVLLVSIWFAQTAQTAQAAQAQTTTASLHAELEALLRVQPEYRLLTQDDVGWQDSMYVEFTPYDIADTNGDGINDIVAILVKERRDRAGLLFSLVCLQSENGAKDHKAVWITRDQEEEIMSVDAEKREIFPLVCTNCNSNRSLRWTGSEYDWDVYFVGETACISAGETLVENPADPESRGLSVSNTIEARVIEIGRRDAGQDRWFRVRTLDEKNPREGWIRTRKSPDSRYCN